MSAHRFLPLAAALALAALIIPAAHPASAAPARASNSPQAITAYRSGVAKVLNLFMPANSKIVDTGNDLTRTNWKKASSDAATAVAGIAKSKSALDHLAVPPKAKKIQSLFESAFARFLAGAKQIQSGARKRSVATLQAGESAYQQGLFPLEQATKLFGSLK